MVSTRPGGGAFRGLRVGYTGEDSPGGGQGVPVVSAVPYDSCGEHVPRRGGSHGRRVGYTSCCESSPRRRVSCGLCVGYSSHGEDVIHPILPSRALPPCLYHNLPSIHTILLSRPSPLPQLYHHPVYTIHPSTPSPLLCLHHPSVNTGTTAVSISTHLHHHLPCVYTILPSTPAPPPHLHHPTVYTIAKSTQTTSLPSTPSHAHPSTPPSPPCPHGGPAPSAREQRRWLCPTRRVWPGVPEELRDRVARGAAPQRVLWSPFGGPGCGARSWDARVSAAP